MRTKLAGTTASNSCCSVSAGVSVLASMCSRCRKSFECPPLTVVPQSHPVVLGIANMRGKTIAIMDLAMAIGAPALGDPRDRFVIITVQP